MPAITLPAGGFVLCLAAALGAGLATARVVGAGEPAAPAAAPAISAADEARPGRYPAQVLSVVDGDTFEARVAVWPGLDITTRVRLRGVDAPEMRARCSEEGARAAWARRILEQVLAEGDVEIADVALDKYGGRILARAATRATADVTSTLLAQGAVRPYGGGKRAGWCGAGAAQVRRAGP